MLLHRGVARDEGELAATFREVAEAWRRGDEDGIGNHGILPTCVNTAPDQNYPMPISARGRRRAFACSGNRRETRLAVWC
jgi:hypothetical protein